MVFGLNRGKTWDVADIPDLTGRVAIVTGGNGGIGLITVKEMARRGAKVYMLSRSSSRASSAISEIKQEISSASVEYINFDLTSLKSARKAAEEFIAKEERLDTLVNNAGVMAIPYGLSEDGIEIQACNGVGHAALTLPLLPLLKHTASLPNSQVRIVNISSVGHLAAYEPDFSSLEDLNREYWSTWFRYANSKLSNILLTDELQRRLDKVSAEEGNGPGKIYCLSVHPGIISTDLWLGMDQSWGSKLLAPVHFLRRYLFSTPYQGALTQLYAATSPEVEERDLRAAYLVPSCQVGWKSPLAADKEGKLSGEYLSLCEKLIQASEKED